MEVSIAWFSEMSWNIMQEPRRNTKILCRSNPSEGQELKREPSEENEDGHEVVVTSAQPALTYMAARRFWFYFAHVYKVSSVPCQRRYISLYSVIMFST
jgi:hypothetical protein